MIVTCVLTDTIDNTKTLTLGSVDGTKVTAVTNASGTPPTRSVNADDFTRGVSNVNNVGLTPSGYLAMQATVKDPANSANTLTVASHATDSTLVLVTINSVQTTLKAAELKDGIANCKNNS